MQPGVTREFRVVVVPQSRREYVCVEQEARDDRTHFNGALRSLGYSLDWASDVAQRAEMQAVLREHGFQRIIAMRTLSAHEVIRLRATPCRSMTLKGGT